MSALTVQRFWLYGTEDGALGESDAGTELHVEVLNEWSVFQLDGEVFPSPLYPALVSEFSTSPSYKVDKRKRKNKNGNRKIVQGYKPAEFSITFLIWTPQQYQALRQKLPSINPKYNGDNRKPHRFYYPDADDLDINEIYIDTIESGKFTSEFGVRSYTFKGEEVYEDNKNATSKLKGTGKTKETAVQQNAIEQEFISDDGPPP